MPSLTDIINFCNSRISVDEIKDFSGAYNGLQIENDGSVSKIGAAVDAGLVSFKKLRMKILIFLLFTTVFSGHPLPLLQVQIIKR